MPVVKIHWSETELTDVRVCDQNQFAVRHALRVVQDVASFSHVDLFLWPITTRRERCKVHRVQAANNQQKLHDQNT